MAIAAATRRRFVRSRSIEILSITPSTTQTRPSVNDPEPLRPAQWTDRVAGHGPSLEDFTRETPSTVGSPQEVTAERLPVAW